ncbi:hypothetical protein ACG2LH_07030 [Zhouia sp. PK063]|uniref:hypothetical protein n=1 Tax=Zhouia sp. PK063 TaxID=3373602 RepID=UPI00379CDE6D
MKTVKFLVLSAILGLASCTPDSQQQTESIYNNTTIKNVSDIKADDTGTDPDPTTDPDTPPADEEGSDGNTGQHGE